MSATTTTAIPLDRNPEFTAATTALLLALRDAMAAIRQIQELDPDEYVSLTSYDDTANDLQEFANEIEEDLECFECLTGNLIPVHLLPEWNQD